MYVAIIIPLLQRYYCPSRQQVLTQQGALLAHQQLGAIRLHCHLNENPVDFLEPSLLGPRVRALNFPEKASCCGPEKGIYMYPHCIDR